jgi:hypothetical protein
MRDELKIGMVFFILGILITGAGSVAYVYQNLITRAVIVTGVICLTIGFFGLAALQLLMAIRPSRWIVVAVYPPAAHDVIGEYEAVSSEHAKHKAQNHNMWDVATERMEENGGYIVIASVDSGEEISVDPEGGDKLFARP